MVGAFGPQFRYVPFDAGRHAYGHPQLDVGISLARGAYLSFQDDDDVWAPGAVAAIHNGIRAHPERPLLFRFLNYYQFVIWLQVGLFQEGCIGGHCLVCPNRPGALGTWTDNYTGDWGFVDETVRRQGGSAALVWMDDVIAIARPDKPIASEIWRLYETWATSRQWPVQTRGSELIEQHIARALRRVFVDVGYSLAPGWTALGRTLEAQIRHDPLDWPWPIADGSVYYLRCLDFIQHVPMASSRNGIDPLLRFFDEAYRVLEPGGTLFLTFPYSSTHAAWADPTNRRPISEAVIGLASAKLRQERGQGYLPVKCDFNVSHGFVQNENAQVTEAHAELTKIG
jgi:hypothetical protein